MGNLELVQEIERAKRLEELCGEWTARIEELEAAIRRHRSTQRNRYNRANAELYSVLPECKERP